MNKSNITLIFVLMAILSSVSIGFSDYICNDTLSINTTLGENATIWVENGCTDLSVNASDNTLINLEYNLSNRDITDLHTFNSITNEQVAYYVTYNFNFDNAKIDNFINPQLVKLKGNNQTDLSVYTNTSVSNMFYDIRDFEKFNITAPNDTTYRRVYGQVRNVQNYYSHNVLMTGIGASTFETINPLLHTYIKGYTFDDNFSLSSASSFGYGLFSTDIVVTQNMIDNNLLNYNNPITSLNSKTAIVKDYDYALPTTSSTFTIGNFAYSDNFYKFYNPSLIISVTGGTTKFAGFNIFQFMNTTNVTDFENNITISTSILNPITYLNYNGVNVGNAWVNKDGENLYECPSNITDVVLSENATLQVCSSPVLIGGVLNDYIVVGIIDTSASVEVIENTDSFGNLDLFIGEIFLVIIALTNGITALMTGNLAVLILVGTFIVFLLGIITFVFVLFKQSLNFDKNK